MMSWPLTVRMKLGDGAREGLWHQRVMALPVPGGHRLVRTRAEYCGAFRRRVAECDAVPPADLALRWPRRTALIAGRR
jgi:hypothetical protein